MVQTNQEALSCATTGRIGKEIIRSKNTGCSQGDCQDLAFFGQTPVFHTRNEKRNAVTSKKSNAINFFEMDSSTGDFITPQDLSPPRKETRESSTSPGEGRMNKKDSQRTSRHRSRSRHRSKSARNLNATQPKKKPPDVRPRSSSGGRRSSSRTRVQAKRAESESRDSHRSRSKSRGHGSTQSMAENNHDRPIRRMPKTQTPTKSFRCSTSGESPHTPRDIDVETRRCNSKSRAEKNDMLRLDFGEATKCTGRARNGGPLSPPEKSSFPDLSTKTDHPKRRPALARRRAERSARSIGSASPTSQRKSPRPAVDEPPTPPIRAHETKSPSIRSSKTGNSRGNSMTRRRALSKRNLLDDPRSTHSTDTEPIMSSPSVQHHVIKDLKRSTSVPIGSAVTRPMIRDNCVSGSGARTTRPLSFRGLKEVDTTFTGAAAAVTSASFTTSTTDTSTASTVAASSTTPAVGTARNTDEEPIASRRPGLLRDTNRASRGSGRKADGRIDGLLQKLRDPSCRNLGAISTSRPITSFGTSKSEQDEVVFPTMKKMGVFSRLTRRTSLAGVRLDE